MIIFQHSALIYIYIYIDTHTHICVSYNYKALFYLEVNILREILVHSAKLWGKIIISTIMAFFVIFSTTLIFTTLFTQNLGYNIYSVDKNGERKEKLYTYYFPLNDVAIFSVYTFLFACISLLIYSVFINKKNQDDDNALSKRVYIHTFIISIAQFTASYFQSLASKEIDAIVLYPVMNALSLISGSLMAMFIFKEKIKRDAIIGIILTLFAVVLSR